MMTNKLWSIFLKCIYDGPTHINNIQWKKIKIRQEIRYDYEETVTIRQSNHNCSYSTYFTTLQQLILIKKFRCRLSFLLVFYQMFMLQSRSSKIIKKISTGTIKSRRKLQQLYKVICDNDKHICYFTFCNRRNFVRKKRNQNQLNQKK